MLKVKIHAEGVGLPLAELRSIGARSGIVFAPDYAMFVMLGHAGAQPFPNVFPIRPDMGNATISQFTDPRDIADALANAPHLYEDDLYPVAQEGTGDKLCLKRHGGGGVWYVAHDYLEDPDRARTLLAANWTEFLEMLEPMLD
jgi:hypothetical protein